MNDMSNTFGTVAIVAGGSTAETLDSPADTPEAAAKTSDADVIALLNKQIQQIIDNRTADGISSDKSSWKSHASQLEEAQKRRNIERVQSVLKGVGMVGQAMTVVMDEKTQRKLAPTLKAIQLGTTAVNGVLSAVFGSNATGTKLDFLQAQMDKYAPTVAKDIGHKPTFADLHNGIL